MTNATSIKITPAFDQILCHIAAQGKTAWIILNDDYAVGAYPGREAARHAKATNSLAGSIVKASEISFEVVDLMAGHTGASQVLADEVDSQDPTDTEIAESNDWRNDPSSVYGHEIHGLLVCPSCGTHLSNGIGEHNQEVNGKALKHDHFEYCCLACGVEFGPAIPSKKSAKAVAPRGPVTHESTATRPCKLVWQIADDVFLANPEAKRSEVLAECVKQGVAYFTARTQYQQWLTVQKEMAAREAEQAAKSAK